MNSVVTIDREARDRLVRAIDQYLDGRIAAFEFDDEIFEIRCGTKDQTVCYVIDSLWYFYDDCKDHTVRLDKSGWGYFQRLLLLLKSDAHVEIRYTRRWYTTQLPAALLLAAFSICAVRFGIGCELVAVAIIFGVASKLLSLCRGRLTPRLSAMERALVPFASVGELWDVRLSVPEFQKRRFPPEVGHSIRSRAEDRLLTFQILATWITFSPLALLAQSLPQRVAKTRVVLGQACQ